MDGTPHLLTDVKFDERRKGYDPEQVDNFLEQISAKVAQLQDMVRQATARADEAEAKIAEAKRAQGVAEAQADKLKADLIKVGERPPVDPEEEAQQASKILLMAQKTADATIEDANRSAQTAVTDARQKAASMVAEAEAEAARLGLEAQRQIDELVAQRRGEVVAEVGGLEAIRDEVKIDVDVLQRHLDEQRTQLRAGLDSLARLLDDPAAFRAAPAPELRTSGNALAGLESETASEDAPSDAAVAEADTISEAEHAEGGTAPADQPDVSVDAAPAEPLDEATVDAAPDAAEAQADISVPDLPAPPNGDASPQEVVPVADAAAEFPDVKVPELMADAAAGGEGAGEQIDLTGDGLFEKPADGGPPTELFTPFEGAADKADPLGKPDDAADAAMRAFFEADFHEDEEPKKPRWRR